LTTIERCHLQLVELLAIGEPHFGAEQVAPNRPGRVELEGEQRAFGGQIATGELIADLTRLELPVVAGLLEVGLLGLHVDDRECFRAAQR
jgi:hypothetical protein